LLDTAVPINILDFTSLDSVNLPSVTCPGWKLFTKLHKSTHQGMKLRHNR